MLPLEILKQSIEARQRRIAVILPARGTRGNVSTQASS